MTTVSPAYTITRPSPRGGHGPSTSGIPASDFASSPTNTYSDKSPDSMRWSRHRDRCPHRGGGRRRGRVLLADWAFGMPLLGPVVAAAGWRHRRRRRAAAQQRWGALGAGARRVRTDRTSILNPSP